MAALLSHLDRPSISRPLAALAAVALAAVAVVHLIDGPSSLQDARYVGVLELALAAATTVTAIALIIGPVRDIWLSAVALASAALLAYIASRTIGLPGSTDDIGNWGQALGIISVAAEVVVVLLAAGALRTARKRGT
jgi:hypothetical protein